MRPHVRFALPDGGAAELGPGDLIGRLVTAALHLDDARVSEAHAMVSLRGRELRLLGLRGRFALGRTLCAEITLEAGQHIALARGLVLKVEHVVLPQVVLGIEGDGLPRQVLEAVNSLTVSGRPSLSPRYEAAAAAHLWSVGAGWRLAIGGGPPQAIDAGDTFQVGAQTFRLLSVPLANAGLVATCSDASRGPLRIESRFDTVHLHRTGEPVAVLTGRPARVMAELIAMGGSAPWEVVAAEVWPDVTERHQLRNRWDITLARLRSRLRALAVREDLLQLGGTGLADLVLREGDVIEDRS
jgi:hypothetical protein